MKEKLQKYFDLHCQPIFPFCPEIQMRELKKAIGEPLATLKTLYTVTVEQPMTKISISMNLT